MSSAPFVLDCPHCNIALGEVGDAGFEVVCARCRYGYCAFTAQVLRRFSRQITLQGRATRQNGIYKRKYELRLALPGGSEQAIDFVVDGHDDSVIVRSKDHVVIVCATFRGEVRQLLQVVNLSRGETFTLASPDEPNRTSARRWAWITALVGLVFFTKLFASLIAALSCTPLVVFAVYKLYRSYGPPRQKITPEAERAATERGIFLTRKNELLQARADAQRQMDEARGRRSRLLALKKKMEFVGEDVYRSKLLDADRALQIVWKMESVAAQSVEQYDKQVAVLEIEAESSLIGTPEELGAVLETKQAELAGLRDQMEELEIELGAIDQVELLLRAG
ncbi:MAG TPA: hypothetical protein VI072_29200 [Polyangiaceae bacterium]